MNGALASFVGFVYEEQKSSSSAMSCWNSGVETQLGSFRVESHSFVIEGMAVGMILQFQFCSLGVLWTSRISRSAKSEAQHVGAGAGFCNIRCDTIERKAVRCGDSST